jgi:hypothetical protein
MINPNRSYKSKCDAVIVKVDPTTAYIPYVTVQTADGTQYEGSLRRCHSRWKSLKEGDRVGFTVQFSIMAQKYMIDRVIVRRK